MFALRYFYKSKSLGVIRGQIHFKTSMAQFSSRKGAPVYMPTRSM